MTAFRFPGPRPVPDDSVTGDPLTLSAARTLVKREPQYEDSPYDYTANPRSTADASAYRPVASLQSAPAQSLPYQDSPRYSASPASSLYNSPRSSPSRAVSNYYFYYYY